MIAMPREKIELDIQQVEELASQGLTMEQIATCLGISDKTIYRRKKEQSELSAAIKRGQERGVAFAASQLRNLIAEGNLGAVIFYLKSKGKWSEKIDLSGTVNVNANVRADGILGWYELAEKKCP